jgi:hypothetical protein
MKPNLACATQSASQTNPPSGEEHRADDKLRKQAQETNIRRSLRYDAERKRACWCSLHPALSL